MLPSSEAEERKRKALSMKPTAGRAQIKADPTCLAQELRLSPGSGRGLCKVLCRGMTG